jgi:hypothetical protein
MHHASSYVIVDVILMHHGSSYVIVDVKHSLGDTNQIIDMAHISCKYDTCSGHQVTKIKKTMVVYITIQFFNKAKITPVNKLLLVWY